MSILEKTFKTKTLKTRSPPQSDDESSNKRSKNNVNVTTFVKTFFEPFDLNKVIKNILNSEKMNDPSYEYFGMNRNEILTSFRDSSISGTKLHSNIRKHSLDNSHRMDTPEFAQYLQFMNVHSGLSEIECERKVSDSTLEITGAVDMIAKNADDEYVLIDWKRTKKIELPSSTSKRSTHSSLSHIKDCNFIHYSMQLNLYKYLLRREFDIKHMYIVQLHPNISIYEIFTVPDMSEEIKIMIDERLLKLGLIRKSDIKSIVVKSPELPEEELAVIFSEMASIEETRNSALSFVEEDHKYFVEGWELKSSVTEFVGSFFEPFDENAIAEKITMSSKMSNPTYEYFGLSKEQIIEKWKHGTQLGTDLHNQIDNFFKGIEPETKSKEFGFFLKYISENPVDFWRSEMRIYHEELDIAGSVDLITKNKNGEVDLIDWKRSKRIDKHGFNHKCVSHEGLTHVPDSNYYKYAFQLNMYKYILQSKYKMKVRNMRIVVMHPMNFDYITFDIPHLDREIDIIIQNRLSELERIRNNNA